jgi:uncharacterized membrane protein YqjE
VQNRLQLLGVELAEERGRLLSLLTYGAIALICLSAGLVFLAVFLTVLLWDSHRLLALGMFSALFLGAGIATPAGGDEFRQGRFDAVQGQPGMRVPPGSMHKVLAARNGER